VYGNRMIQTPFVACESTICLPGEGILGWLNKTSCMADAEPIREIRRKTARAVYVRRQENMRTIRVTGKGQIRVRPDMTRIVMEIEGITMEYSEALRRASVNVEKLKDLVAGFGLKRSDLKTLNFNVNTEYESYKQNDVYRQRFVGYKVHQDLKIEFPSDHELLGRMVYALAHCPVRPEFRLSYTVQDPEAAKNELLGEAVVDARAKALVLTQAAGVRLREIQNIDYSWGEINLEVRPMDRMLMADAMPMKAMAGASDSYDMDMEPDDIEISDTVTVIWEID